MSATVSECGARWEEHSRSRSHSKKCAQMKPTHFLSNLRTRGRIRHAASLLGVAQQIVCCVSNTILNAGARRVSRKKGCCNSGSAAAVALALMSADRRERKFASLASQLKVGSVPVVQRLRNAKVEKVARAIPALRFLPAAAKNHGIFVKSDDFAFESDGHALKKRHQKGRRCRHFDNTCGR